MPLDRANEMALLSVLLEPLPGPALIVDRRHLVLAVNAAFRRRVAGRVPVEGRRCYELLHGRRRPCGTGGRGCPLETCVATGAPVHAIHSHVAARRRRREGIRLRPLMETDGHIVACLATLEPVHPTVEPREPLSGKSAVAVAAVRAQIPRLARGREPILLVGEAGTGKGSVARALHRLSPNRASFAEGSACELSTQGLRSLLATAVGGGSVYIGDVHALDLEAQAELCEHLTRHPGHGRLILGTDQDLSERVATGAFRADLFARVAMLRLPPLRARLGELPTIAARLLRDAEGPGRTLSPDTLERLRRYPFPGNLDELAQALSHASLMAAGPTVRVEDLPDSVSGGRT